MDGASIVELMDPFVDVNWADDWLEGSEASIRLGNPGTFGTSLFFHDEAGFDAFVDATPRIGRVLRRHDREMRQRFRLAPRRWVKRKVDLLREATAWSQYFQISPRWADYPITTLRLFVRMFGCVPPSDLAHVLEVPLANRGTIWGLALKYPDSAPDSSPRPLLSFTIPPGRLHMVLARLVDGGRVQARAAEQCAGAVSPLLGRRPVYVTVDPARRAGPCVVDLRNVRHDRLPVRDLRVAEDVVFRYAKCRMEPEAESPTWSAYLPLKQIVGVVHNRHVGRA